eukprot:15213894-Alexandrium_andersonii.AAC.1
MSASLVGSEMCIRDSFMGMGGALCKGLRGLNRVLKQARGSLEQATGEFNDGQSRFGRGWKTLVRPWRTLGTRC